MTACSNEFEDIAIANGLALSVVQAVAAHISFLVALECLAAYCGVETEAHFIQGVADAGLPAIENDRSRNPLSVCCAARSEEHTSELQSLMRISYAVFCLKKKKNHNHIN